MKRILLSMAAFSLLFATSCENDLDVQQATGELSTVSFNVATPEIATRAYSDGTTATVLQYAVYDEQGQELTDLTKLDGEIHGNTTVNLQLVSGNTYTVLFWAAAEGAPYTVDFANKKLTVDYAAAKTLSNDEGRDAFYNYSTITVNGAQSETIQLKRPFAQLNLGTSDYAASASAGYEPTQSSVKVSEVYTTLNFVDGTVDGKTSVTYALNDIPRSEKYPVDGYEYLAMNYLLVTKDKSLVDIELSYTDQVLPAKTRTVSSVPVQRNYRTNVYGKLLTSDVDIHVEIKPEYDNDHLEAWDGNTISEPTYDAATKTYYVSDASELAYIAQLVNGTLDTDMLTRAAVPADNLAGKTISLECDINLNDKEWTPIGTDQNRFHGTLEGNGHTIYGLKVSQRHAGKAQAALVANVAGTVAFRNVTFSGASIECPDYTGDYYGAAVVGTMYGNVTFDHVNVVDSYISGNNKVGALVAHDGVCSSLTINACKVSKTTFEALNIEDGGSVGGLVGFFQGVAKGTQAAPYGDHHVSNSQVTDCEFNVVNSTNTGKRANAQLIGGISSKAGQVLYIDQCTVADNTWNEKFYENKVEVTSGTFVSPYGELIGGDRNDAPKGEVYIDGVKVETLKPVAEGVGMDSEDNFVVTADEGLAWIAQNVSEQNGFEGKTIKLAGDVDLATVKTMGDSFAPIGSTGERDDRNRLVCEPFKGTFDGQGHTIKNLHQSGWDFGYEWGQYGSIGLFSELEGATVKNIKLEGFDAAVEGGDIAFIAGSATGDCVFEDIEIISGGIGTYNNGIGSIIGWSGAGNYTFKNIKIGKDVILGGLWGSFDSSVGGIVGQAEPGASYHFEDVEINCRLDVFNDCTASYDYYIYRMSGMIIGRCEETTTIDGRNYPDLTKYNITCKNVTVNYGDWMNYHYCEPTPGLNGGRGMRVEPGYAYDGIPEDYDHSQCTTNHNTCIPFDGLFGGDQYRVHPIKAYEGVTVNYPESYNPEN